MTLDWVAGAFGVAAIALFVAAAISAHGTRRLRRTGVRSLATVCSLKASELDSDESDSNTPALAPVLEFADPDGRVHRIVGGASHPARYTVGELVSVIYDAADPARARVESFAGLWLGVVLTSVGGSVAFGVALLLFWLAR